MATRKTTKSPTKQTSGTGLNGSSKQPLSAPDAGLATKVDSPLSAPDARPAAKADSPLSAPDARPAAKADSPLSAPDGRPAVKAGSPLSAPDGRPAVKVVSPSFEQIRLRAYEIFMARGGTNGNDVSDWLEAERQLRDSGSN